MSEMPTHVPGNVIARYSELPDGFTPYGGGGCPVDPDQLVETMILTAQGIGSGGITRAKDHDWSGGDGIGSLVGYRIASLDDLQ